MTLPIKVYSYSACGSCRKALQWLDENSINYELIDIVQNPPEKPTIAKIIDIAGDKKYLFNTRGISYRKIGAEVIKSMTNKEAIQALSQDGKLIKRPLLIRSSGEFLLGFNERTWNDFFEI